MVVDGRAEFVGSDAAAARKAIERTLTAPHGVVTADDCQTIERRALQCVVCDGRSAAHRARGDRADIIVLITESGLTTDVKRGENHGKVLKHAPVVRYLATIGQIAGDAIERIRARATSRCRPTGSAITSPSSRSCRRPRPHDPRVGLGSAQDRSPVKEYPYWWDTLARRNSRRQN